MRSWSREIATFIFFMLLASRSYAAKVADMDYSTNEYCISSGPGFAGKPVNLRAGDETFTRTDLTVGSLYPITITRTYSSSSGYDSPVGYGWALNHDRRIYTYSDGSITLRKNCGWKRRFAPSGPLGEILVLLGGDWYSCTDYPQIENTYDCIKWDPGNSSPVEGFVSPPAETGRLEKNADGSYTYTEKDGNRENYDVQGKLASLQDPNGNSLVFTYSAVTRDSLWGLLPFNIDQNSSLIVAYDYHLSKIEEKNASGDLTGKWVVFHYDLSTGRLTNIQDSSGRTVTYTYDSIGNLTSVNGPGGSAAYGYTDTNGKHKMTSIDEGQGVYVNTYDASGMVTRQTHGTGILDFSYTNLGKKATVTTTVKDGSGTVLNTRTRSVEFDGNGQVYRDTDTFGNVTNYYRDSNTWVIFETHTDISTGITTTLANTYDAKGNVLTKTEALGTVFEKTTTYTYEPTFNKVLTETALSAVSSALVSIITNSYDPANGNLLTRVESGYLGDGTPYTYTTAFTYDANGKITSIDGPRTDVNDITSYVHDATTGYLTSMTQPIIGTTTYSNSDPLGNPQTITDPNGNATTYTYDISGRVTTVKAAGDTTATQYFYTSSGCQSCGGANKIDHITFPEGNTISGTYDSMGNISTIADSQNNTINYAYDSEGNKLSEQIKDSASTLQKSLSYLYDALNRLARITNPDSTYTQYDYLGNQISARKPNGNTTAYSFDVLTRLNSVTQSGSITTNYRWNKNNNLVSVNDANSNTTSYKMEDKGSVYQVISPDTGTTTYGYDPAGNLTSKTDANGVTISYVYDALNRLTNINFPSDTGIVYVYDTCVNGKGRLCSMTDASGITSYEYTPKGEVKKETKTIDSIQYITQYTYDQNGNLKTMTYPSGKVITYNYSNDRATSVLNGAANLATNIQYKPFGGITAITYGNGVVSTIAYDNQYQLSTLVTSTFQNLTYGYDYNGNITSISPGRTFAYDALDRLATGTGTWGSLRWFYDDVGNRLAENNNVYSYVPNTNKLTAANGISFGYDNNGNTTTQSSRVYTYNQNQRLSQVVDGSMTANYSYNGMGQRVKKAVNGATTVFHYSLYGQLIAESNSAGNITAEYVYLNGQPLAKMEGANTYYYHNDHLATPQKMTDASGTVVWAADYKPFGEATITVSTITNNLRFPGQYFDTETGLHQNNWRDYNPAIGRYPEADPFGLNGGINLYSYVDNEPIDWYDFWGLQGAVMTPAGPIPIYIPNLPRPTPQEVQQAIDNLWWLNPNPLLNFLLDNIFYAKGERNQDSGKGEDKFYDLKKFPDTRALRDFERDKNNSWEERSHAQEARKKREKREKAKKGKCK